jgi:hypothetical protein
MHTNRTITASLAALALLAAGEAGAQSDLLPSLPAKGIGIEAVHPNFRPAELTAASAVLYLTGRMPLVGDLSVVGDVPLVHARFAGTAGEGIDGDGTVLGNPRLGLEYRPTATLTVEASTRLPLTTADDSSVGDFVAVVSDPIRLEAFAKDVLPVTAGLRWETQVAGAFSIRSRAAGTTVFMIGEEGGDRVTFLDYGAFGGYTAGAARLGLGLSGRWAVSEEEGGFSGSSFHFAGATVDYAVGGVRPGLSLQLPIESEGREVLGPQLGVYLRVPLR